MPRIIAGEVDKVKHYMAALWIGAVCNFVLPALESAFFIPLVYKNYAKEPPLSRKYVVWLSDAYSVAKSLTQGAWIVSGLVLIWSVNRIRTAINARNEDGKALNLKTLLVHSSAFALFVISVAINLFFYDKFEIVLARGYESD